MAYPEIAEATVSLKCSSLNDHMPGFVSGFDAGTETRVAYGRAVSGFLKWAGDMPLSAVTVRLYRDYLRNRSIRPNTIGLYLSALRQFFGHLVSEGLLDVNPAREIKRPKVPRIHQRDALDKAQAKHLLDSIDRSNLRGKRDFAMVNLMLRTGLRETEVSRAKAADVESRDGHTILWVHGKGRECKDAYVVLTEEARKPLENYLTERGNVDPAEPLFLSVRRKTKGNGQALSARMVRKIVSRYLIQAGLKSCRVTPHSLRHTAITLAIDKGGAGSLLRVRQMARHASITTTLGYYHERERLKEAAEYLVEL